jgi:hypothetical protein
MSLPAPEAALCYFYRKKGLVYEKISWIYRKKGLFPVT